MPELEEGVVALGLEPPAWGQGRGATELAKRGLSLAPAGGRGVWQRHDWEDLTKRLKALAACARAAGVTGDVVLRRLGTAHHRPCAAQPLRVVRVATDKVHPDGTPVELVLVTNRLDLAADLIALAYRYRWTVELFFRWLKCILGCRHLLSQRENGVQLQVYMALIASLLISLWVGRAPTKRTYELLCFYLSGWARAAEVITPIDRLHLTAPPSKQ